MHVFSKLLDAVARGEAPRELLDEVEKGHIAGSCPVCASAYLTHEARAHRPGAWSREEPRDRLERVRRRLVLPDVELHAKEKEAREWVRAAVRYPPEVRRDKAANAYVRFRGPLFCVLLLEEARSRIPGDPAEALSLADTAIAANGKIAVYQPDPEVQAPALAVRGNAKRALGRLVAAEADLEEAERLLDSPGVTDPETAAEVYSYLGSLRKDQGRLDEAVHHLRLAAAVYGLLGVQDKAARVLVKLGLAHYVAHRYPDAVSATEEALRLLDQDSNDWLRAYARYNLAHHLHAAGETDRAEAELATHEALIAGATEQLANLLVWLRARIAWSRGDLEAAEALFAEARERALARGIAWDAGLVALELALVLLARGRRTARVKALALEALPVFAEQEVARETRACLELLEAAARRDALTKELFERAIASLERAQTGAGGATA